MKILFIAHLYPPVHCAGAEFYIHELGRFFISKGHEVRVLLRQATYKNITENYSYDGVDVFISNKKYSSEVGPVEEQLNWCTHMIAHLENSEWAVNVARMFKKKVFYISHNSWDYPCINQRRFTEDQKYPVGVIYNSEWMRELLNYPQKSIVLRPPIDKDKVDANNKPENAKFITIINANERKGGHIFWKIAKKMPDHQFLIVCGAYDEQVMFSSPNVNVYKQMTDMLPMVYKQTRLLLVPSAYESWGMACGEAMANGIPVICSPTPGLKENASYAGVFVDSPRMQKWMDMHTPPTDMLDIVALNNWVINTIKPPFDYFDEDKSILSDEDIDMWVEEIKRFDDKEYYNCMSQKCRQRAAELDPRKELLAVEKFLDEN